MSSDLNRPDCSPLMPEGHPRGLCPRCALIALLQEGKATEAPAHPPGPGGRRRFGDYELLEEIASGGMGVVYKARQLSLERLVAVKFLLRGSFASADFIKRFRIEAAAAAALQHPNIVAVHEVGVHGDEHYLVMDYVEGSNLAQLMRNEPLPPVRAAQYLMTIAEAIHYAHERGILHRDLKPSNVLIDAYDRPRVTDFGLAKRFDPLGADLRQHSTSTIHVNGRVGEQTGVSQTTAFSHPAASSLTHASPPVPHREPESLAAGVEASDPHLTLTGHVIGSPNFLPPEQAGAKGIKTGRYSDVYGMGAILYYLLTGRPPFQGESIHDTLQNVVNQEPLPPRLLQPAVAVDLETICLKCLQKEPERRYATAHALSEELGRFLRHEPIQARPVSRMEKAGRWCRRHPTVAGLAAGVVVLLLTLVVGASVTAVRMTRLRKVAEMHLRDSLIAQARQTRAAGGPGQRFDSLAALTAAMRLDRSDAFRQRIRDEVIASLALPDLRWVAATNLPKVDESKWQASFDPDFKMLIQANGSEALRIVRLGDGREAHPLVTAPLKTQAIQRFSPDGRFVALRHGEQLGVWDLRTRSNVVLAFCWPHPRAFNFPGMAFSHDSRSVAYGDAGNQILIHELPGGARRHAWTLPSLPSSNSLSGWAMAFSPDNLWLACASARETGIVLRSLADGRVGATLPVDGLIRSLEWSRDGRWLAGAEVDGVVIVWDMRTRRRHARFEGHLTAAHDIGFDRTGELLVSASLDHATRVWDLVRERPLFEFFAGVNGPYFDADNRRLGLMAQQHQPGWLECSLSEVLRVQRQVVTDDWPPTLAFSRDGGVLAAGCKAGLLFLDGRTGAALGEERISKVSGLVFGSNPRRLFMADTGGVWQLTLDVLGQGPLQIVERRSLLHGSGWQDLTLAREGDLLMALQRPREMAAIFSLNEGRVIREIRGRPFDQASLSPDARFLFTSQHSPARAEVWDLRTGAVVTELQADSNWRGAFSEDGRWLINFSRDCRLWRTSDWTMVTQIHLESPNAFTTSDGIPVGGGAALRPDGRLLALVHDLQEIQLYQWPEARRVATLPRIKPTCLQTLAFSPDGDHLAAANTRGEVHLWDLAALRVRLGTFGLDWP